LELKYEPSPLDGSLNLPKKDLDLDDLLNENNNGSIINKYQEKKVIKWDL